MADVLHFIRVEKAIRMNKPRFVREVGTRLGCNPRRAGAITFVVLQELRNRLTPEEVADVSAQLPIALRRFWHEHDGGRRIARTHPTEFLGRIRRWAALADEAAAEHAVGAVFAVFQRLLDGPSGTEGEACGIFGQLPNDLKPLWLAARDMRPASAAAPAARGGATWPT